MGAARLGMTLAFAFTPALTAAQAGITFDGERYEQRFENRNDGVQVVEYLRSGETLKDWTKLVAIRHFPKLNDPKAAAGNLARVVQQHNPQARSQVLAKDDGSEAVVDFLTWSPGDDRLELNIHRYQRISGVPGLVAYQFAWRFRSAELPGDGSSTVRANRQRWLDLMLKAKWPNPFAR
jgi:hypothetical protein